jgi:hypothetical protein
VLLVRHALLLTGARLCVAAPDCIKQAGKHFTPLDDNPTG